MQITHQPGATPGKDTYLSMRNATSNFGTTATLNCGYVISGADDARRALLEAEFDGLLPNRVLTRSRLIKSTTFTIVVTSAAASAEPSHWYRMTGTWTEAGATWNTSDGSAAWPGGAGGEGAYTTDNGVAFTQPTGTGAASYDLTQLHKDAIDDGDTHLGTMGRRDTESGDQSSFVLGSSDNTTEANRPTWTVICDLGPRVRAGLRPRCNRPRYNRPRYNRAGIGCC